MVKKKLTRPEWISLFGYPLPVTIPSCKFLIFWLLISYSATAQNTVEKHVNEGIQYHDAGDYEGAIAAYQLALALDESSALANYEIAMTYMYAGQYEKALIHANKVISLNEQYLIPSYVTIGNCLDALGKSDEAIRIYEKAIKEIGGDYLLYYNLGVTQYNLGNRADAEQAVINAIQDNSSHPGSHLLLGYLMKHKDDKVKSILALHYFLLLEPGSERSPGAFRLLNEQFSGNIERAGAKDINILISPESLDKKNEFGSAEMMISLLAASNTLEENHGKSDEELFIKNTESFFKILGELKKKKNKGLWWDFYVPFYYELAETEHLEPYCYYISQSGSKVAIDWLKENESRINQFKQWLSE